MAVNISISPKKVWKEAIEVANEFACFGSIALGIIAEDNERGIRVCMRHNDTKSDVEYIEHLKTVARFLGYSNEDIETGLKADSVYIYAIKNDTVVASKLTNSADECEKTVEEFLKKYLFKASKEDSDE